MHDILLYALCFSSSDHGSSFSSVYRNPNPSDFSGPDQWKRMGEGSAGGAPWSQNSFYENWTAEMNPSATDRCGWDQNAADQGSFIQSPGYGEETGHNSQPHEGHGQGFVCGNADCGHQTCQASTRASLENFRLLHQRRRARPLEEGQGVRTQLCGQYFQRYCLL